MEEGERVVPKGNSKKKRGVEVAAVAAAEAADFVDSCFSFCCSMKSPCFGVWTTGKQRQRKPRKISEVQDGKMYS